MNQEEVVARLKADGAPFIEELKRMRAEAKQVLESMKQDAKAANNAMDADVKASIAKRKAELKELQSAFKIAQTEQKKLLAESETRNLAAGKSQKVRELLEMAHAARAATGQIKALNAEMQKLATTGLNYPQNNRGFYMAQFGGMQQLGHIPTSNSPPNRRVIVFDEKGNQLSGGRLPPTFNPMQWGPSHPYSQNPLQYGPYTGGGRMVPSPNPYGYRPGQFSVPDYLQDAMKVFARSSVAMELTDRNAIIDAATRGSLSLGKGQASLPKMSVMEAQALFTSLGFKAKDRIPGSIFFDNVSAGGTHPYFTGRMPFTPGSYPGGALTGPFGMSVLPKAANPFTVSGMTGFALVNGQSPFGGIMGPVQSPAGVYSVGPYSTGTILNANGRPALYGSKRIIDDTLLNADDWASHYMRKYAPHGQYGEQFKRDVVPYDGKIDRTHQSLLGGADFWNKYYSIDGVEINGVHRRGTDPYWGTGTYNKLTGQYARVPINSDHMSTGRDLDRSMVRELREAGKSWKEIRSTMGEMGGVSSRAINGVFGEEVRAKITNTKHAMSDWIKNVRGNSIVNGFERIGGAGVRAFSAIGGAARSLVGRVSPIGPLLDFWNSRFITIVGTMAALGAAAAAIRKGLTSAMDYQDTLTSLSVMTGSPERGKKLLDDIQQFGIATPFKQEDLLQSARTLHGFGVETHNIMPALKAIGEITAGAGGGAERFQRITLAFGQVVSKGFLKGEEVRQFANAGVGVRDFADALDVSTPKLMRMMKLGQVESDVLYKAFNKLTGEGGRFGGTMEKLAMNARGRWNTIQETFSLGLQKAGLKFFAGIDKAGVFDVLDRWMETFNKNTEEMGPWDNIGKGFRGALIGAEVAAEDLWSIFKDIGDEISRMAGGTDGLTNTFENLASVIAAIPAAMKDTFLYAKAMYLDLMSTIGPITEKIGKVVSNPGSSIWNGIQDAVVQGVTVDMNPLAYLFDDEAGRDEMRNMVTNGRYGETDRLKRQYEAEANQYYDKAGTNTTAALERYFDKLNSRKEEQAAQKRLQDRSRIISGISPLGVQFGFNELNNQNRGGVPMHVEKMFEEIYKDEKIGGYQGGIRGIMKSLNDINFYRTSNVKARFMDEYNARSNEYARMRLEMEQGDDPELKKVKEERAREIVDYRIRAQKILDKENSFWKPLLGGGIRGIDDEDAAMAGKNILDDLRKEFGDKIPDRQVRFQSGGLYGSQEAQDAVNAAMFGEQELSIQEEMRELLKAGNEEREKFVKKIDEYLKAIEEFAKNQPAPMIQAAPLRGR